MELRLAFGVIGAALAAGYALCSLFTNRELGVITRLKYAAATGIAAALPIGLAATI